MYHVLKQLWNTVTPGRWVVRPFTSTTDPDLRHKSPIPGKDRFNDGLFRWVNMVAWSGEGKMAILITNDTGVTKNLTVKGINFGAGIRRYLTDGPNGGGNDMERKATSNPITTVNNVRQATLELPPQSVTVWITEGTAPTTTLQTQQAPSGSGS